MFTSRGEAAIDCCNYRSDEWVIGFAGTSQTQTAGASSERRAAALRLPSWPLASVTERGSQPKHSAKPTQAPPLSRCRASECRPRLSKEPSSRCVSSVVPFARRSDATSLTKRKELQGFLMTPLF